MHDWKEIKGQKWKYTDKMHSVFVMKVNILLKRFGDKEIMDSCLSHGELHIDWTTLHKGFLRYVHIWMPLKNRNFYSPKYLKGILYLIWQCESQGNRMESMRESHLYGSLRKEPYILSHRKVKSLVWKATEPFTWAWESQRENRVLILIWNSKRKKALQNVLWQHRTITRIGMVGHN